MELIITLLLVWVILQINKSVNPNPATDFIKNLAKATQARYAFEYAKLRSPEQSHAVLQDVLHSIAPSNGIMNPFHYQDFKSGVLKAIHNSDKSLKAELCFIHDLMIEEYHKLLPSKKVNYEVGINEFYNLFRTHL